MIELLMIIGIYFLFSGKLDRPMPVKRTRRTRRPRAKHLVDFPRDIHGNIIVGEPVYSFRVVN